MTSLYVNLSEEVMMMEQGCGLMEAERWSQQLVPEVDTLDKDPPSLVFLHNQRA